MKIATLLLLILPLLLMIRVQSSPTPSLTQNSGNDPVDDIPPKEHYEVTLPLPTDHATPACSVNVLTYSFGNTSDSPPSSMLPMSSPLISDGLGNTSGSPSISVIYTPPPATCEWSHAVLQYQAAYKGEQYGSIGGFWIDGVELLRTSTAHPTEDGALWNVRKDVTRYSSILTQEDLTLSVMLGNLGNDEFTGVYQVNVSFLFYSNEVLVVSGESEAQTLNRKLISVKTHENEDKLELDRVLKSLYPYDTPADLIVPISDEGYWFKIEDEFDVRTTNVQISPTTYKAVLELYVSFHGDDETWYMNPPDSYIQANNLTTGGHGAYREVLVTIDGNLVGTVIPFPVIFPNGVNPFFWSPVVSIGAFDLPSYDIDLTPYLGLLLDNMNHSIGLQVAHGISFWLVNANLHLWSGDSNVQAIMEFGEPSMEIETEYDFESTEGEFETLVERSSEATAWVQSSTGIVKTKVNQEFNFRNRVKFEDDGNTKELDLKIKTMTKIKITNEKGDTTAKVEIEKIYPLTIVTETEPLFGKDISVSTAAIVQGRSESFSDKKAKISRVLNHDQNCTSSMMVKDDSVIEGSVENHQKYDYTDGLGCYSRKVDVVDGDVVADERLLICGD